MIDKDMVYNWVCLTCGQSNGEQEKNDEIYRFYDVLYYKLLDVRQEIKLGD
jgi:hypothetical protein